MHKIHSQHLFLFISSSFIKRNNNAKNPQPTFIFIYFIFIYFKNILHILEGKLVKAVMLVTHSKYDNS